MFDLNEVAEMAWLPVALLAAVLVWRFRSASLFGRSETGWLQAWGAGSLGAANNWMVASAGLAFRWIQRVRHTNGVLSSGNQSFDDYRNDALRGLEDERREFRDYLKRLRRIRDQFEFDAFMADKAK